MNRVELIAIAIRLLSEKSSVIPKSDPLTESINRLFGFESQETRIARGLDEDLTKLTNAVTTFNFNRKFKKLTKNF